MPDFEIAYNEILEYLKNQLNLETDKQELFKILLFLINTISRTRTNCDDSNGEIVRSFYAVLNFIKEFVKEADDKLFSLIYSELTNPKNEYDFELD
ncbi:MAG: hypothetical protein LUG16_02835, partial [Candidatus Gastranaerophilales bacterium]|nr:hypothetical protein [Candidatus Gastranaerophilales bacterium]